MFDWSNDIGSICVVCTQSLDSGWHDQIDPRLIHCSEAVGTDVFIDLYSNASPTVALASRQSKEEPVESMKMPADAVD